MFGEDPWGGRVALAARTGTMLQESGLIDEMTVAGQLSLWQGVSVRQDSIDRVLDIVGLSHRRRTPVSVLSGGERRRLDFAMAMWGGPELIILDEPTTGLDPQSRRSMWEIIRELNGQGSTVLITTHYLEEAQSLAESVTILDHGRIAVQGAMGQVLASIPAQISFTVTAAEGAVKHLETLAAGEVSVFLRQPVMVALALLVPLGLTAITAITEISDNHNLWAWAVTAGRNMVATQCITVYFVSLNTLTARRHTLALKRLRTTALPSIGILGGLLATPLLVGAFQILVVFGGLIVLGSPLPQRPGLVVLSSVLGMAVALLAGIATSGFTSTPEKAQWTDASLLCDNYGGHFCSANTRYCP